MKKATIFLLLLLGGLTGCKFVKQEIKKTNQIRKITKEKCECRYVAVDKNMVDGNGVLTLTLRKSSSEDFPATAQNIYENLQEKYPNICNYAEVFIIFENEDEDEGFDQRFTYFDCDQPAEHDSIFYDAEYDEYLDEEDWEAFMDDSI